MFFTGIDYAPRIKQRNAAYNSIHCTISYELYHIKLYHSFEMIVIIGIFSLLSIFLLGVEFIFPFRRKNSVICLLLGMYALFEENKC